MVPMYEVVLKDKGFRVPFTDFRWTSSHIHPNSMAFIQDFEKKCEYLQLTPTILFLIFDFYNAMSDGSS